VVRRISGRSLGHVLPRARSRDRSARLLDRAAREPRPRVARIAPPPPSIRSDPFGAALLDKDSLTRRAFMNPSTLYFAGGAEFARQLRAAEIPAANGIANARGLAGMYAPLAARGGRLVDAARSRACRGRVRGPDRILIHRTRFASGFMKSVDAGRATAQARARTTPRSATSARAVARHGRSRGGDRDRLCDEPDGPGLLLNERGQSLVDAVYDCL
jgi:hypothetical protein